MCGRYALALRPSQVRQQLQDVGMPVWEAPDDDATRPSYNVAPGYYEPVYRAMVPEPDHGAAAARDGRAANGDGDDGTDEPTSTVSDDQARREKQKKKTKEEVRYQLQAMKWGLVPSWTKRNPDYGSTLKTINCRDDSLLENRGMWNTMKRTKRCIVFCQGFYEWLKKNGGKEKVPYFVKRRDGQLMCLAGLWDCVRYEGSDEKLYTYTIITTDSNASLKFLHDRMPVILDHGSDAIWVWLDPARSTWSTELQSLLRPYQGALDVYPVRKEVGKVGNNSAAFIVPLSSSADKHSIANFLNRGKAVKPDQAPTSTSDHRDDRSRIKCDDDNRATVSSDINPDSRAPPSIPTRPDTAPPDRKRKAVEDDEGSSSTADGDEAGNASSTAPVTRPFTRRRRPRCATSNVTAKSRPDRSSSAIDGSRTITQFWGGVDE